MYQDQTNGANWQITDGMTVYGSDGTKLGTVRNFNPADGYLDVRKGWLFPKDFYVPINAVETVSDDGITLRLSQDALTDERYASPLTGDRATTGATQYDSGDYTQTTTSDYRSSRTGAATGNTTLNQGEDIRVPVREEELIAGTRPEEEGRVHVHKDVIEEQQTINVPVTRERVTVERAPLSGRDVPMDDAFTERDIDVPVMGEEVVAEKRVRGVEEVRIRKDAFTEQQQVSDTVRKERVSVDADPNDLLVDKTGGRTSRGGDTYIDSADDAAVDAGDDVRRTSRGY